jgi:hypothetical protein
MWNGCVGYAMVGSLKGQGKLKKLDGLQLRKLVDSCAAEYTRDQLTILLREISLQTGTTEQQRARDTRAILDFVRSVFTGAREPHVESNFFEVLQPPIDVRVDGLDDKGDKVRYILTAQAEGCTIRTKWNWKSLRSWNDSVIKKLCGQCERKSSLYKALRAAPTFPPTRSRVTDTTPKVRQEGLEAYFAEMGNWAAALREEHGLALHGIHHVHAFLLPAAGQTITEGEVDRGNLGWYNQHVELR